MKSAVCRLTGPQARVMTLLMISGAGGVAKATPGKESSLKTN
jgi:hypothetical protein